MKNKKGQIGPREIMLLLGVLFLLTIVLPILTTFINSLATGNIDALVEALVPLFIFAMIFNFIRRFFA